MSEKSRPKTNKGDPTSFGPKKKPFDITTYVNPISIGSVLSLISLGLYYKYKLGAWEYENLMKSKQCNSIEEAVQLPGQYVNFPCEASADKYFVSTKIKDGQPARAIIIKKVTSKKERGKKDFMVIEEHPVSESILRRPIILTNSSKSVKVEVDDYIIDEERGIQLEEIAYHEGALPKQFVIPPKIKDPYTGKLFERESVLWPGTPLTAFGVIKKIDGKYELVRDRSKPSYLTTKTTDQIITQANEKVHPNFYWSALGTGGVGACLLTVGIIKYLSK